MNSGLYTRIALGELESQPKDTSGVLPDILSHEAWLRDLRTIEVLKALKAEEQKGLEDARECVGIRDPSDYLKASRVIRSIIERYFLAPSRS